MCAKKLPGVYDGMVWQEEVRSFIEIANERGLRMLLVGGGAVNWYGYKRHSADVDFWLDREPANLAVLLGVLRDLGYELDALPQSVHAGMQNVSLKSLFKHPLIG